MIIHLCDCMSSWVCVTYELLYMSSDFFLSIRGPTITVISITILGHISNIGWLPTQLCLGVRGPSTGPGQCLPNVYLFVPHPFPVFSNTRRSLSHEFPISTRQQLPLHTPFTAFPAPGSPPVPTSVPSPVCPAPPPRYPAIRPLWGGCLVSRGSRAAQGCQRHTS